LGGRQRGATSEGDEGEKREGVASAHGSRWASLARFVGADEAGVRACVAVEVGGEVAGLGNGEVAEHGRSTVASEMEIAGVEVVKPREVNGAGVAVHALADEGRIVESRAGDIRGDALDWRAELGDENGVADGGGAGGTKKR